MVLRELAALKRRAIALGAAVMTSKSFDLGFLCSHPIDEVWIRSTALECAKQGLTVELIVCGGTISDHARRLYFDKGVSVACYPELSAWGKRIYGALITASSGLNRCMFSSSARHFIHMPHSLCSLHMIYPQDAFRGYDTLFACGPHHKKEFAALSKEFGVAPKGCWPVGYGKLDILAGALPKNIGLTSADRKKRVLIAPSWGPGNLIESFGANLCDRLLEEGLDVVMRPHPMFFLEERPELLHFEQLEKKYPHFRLESSMSSDGEAILHADVLVGDYSGISLEFAALRRMPVVSVDVRPKVVNRNWQDLEIEPIELRIREKLGMLVEPDLQSICDAVLSIVSAPSIEPTSQTEISSFLYGRAGSCSLEAFNAISSLLGGEV